MLPAFFASDAIAATARRPGFVKRTSKMPGILLLTLVTCGMWSAAKTTFAPLAAQVPQVGEPVAVSPAAMAQRMNTQAGALLQALIRQTLAKVHSLATVCEDPLLPSFAHVSLADSPGFGLPASLQATCPGSGGRAAPAGAKMPALWEYQSRVWGHGVLTPWHMPEHKEVDTVVA